MVVSASFVFGRKCISSFVFFSLSAQNVLFSAVNWLSNVPEVADIERMQNADLPSPLKRNLSLRAAASALLLQLQLLLKGVHGLQSDLNVFMTCECD